MEIHMEEKSPFLASCVEWGASSLIELGPLCLFRGAIYSLANSVWFGLVWLGRIISRPFVFVHTII